MQRQYTKNLNPGIFELGVHNIELANLVYYVFCWEKMIFQQNSGANIAELFITTSQILIQKVFLTCKS